MSSLCIITLAIGLGQLDRAEWALAPKFIPGVELVYRGVCTEQSLVPGVKHERQYDVEMILLMQDQGPNFGNAVLQTSLTLKQPGAGPTAPGSVRIEHVQLDRRGGLHRRFKSADEEDNLAIPLDGPPVQETGAFFEMPVVPVNRLSYWEEFEDHRPLRGWRIGHRPIDTPVVQYIGTPCLKLQWTQQSPDWKAPRADSTAWRRQDSIWFAYQAGQVFRVERIIERREPGRTEATQRILTSYDLESRFRLEGRFFEDRMSEIAKIGKFQREALPYLLQPAQHAKQIDNLLSRIAEHTSSTPANPYRKALLHLKSKLERARSGELPVSAPKIEKPVENAKPLSIGQKVPDFLVVELTSLTTTHTRQFHKYLGQPILLLYYDPDTALGTEVLRFAQKLCDEHGDDILVLGMAVSDDVKQVCRQHEEMDLSFPILDGKAMIRTFGVDGTPRVVLLDGEGVLRFAFTGWGYHSPTEVAREVRRLLPKK